MHNVRPANNTLACIESLSEWRVSGGVTFEPRRMEKTRRRLMSGEE